jgi:hypothetical protein
VAEADEVNHLLDGLVRGKSTEEIFGRDGMLKGLTKRAPWGRVKSPYH